MSFAQSNAVARMDRLSIGLVFSVLFASFLLIGFGGGDSDNNGDGKVQFKTIVAGGAHSFALSNDGKVYA
ncbi:MAG: hypothetical protein LBE89_05595, partial [Helicobacteraceae bacterium]|nr:hypothetical protein [Helicobacteraceae bacterium]